MAPTIEMTTTWERTCELEDLEPGWGEVALLGARQVALVRVGGDEVYALDHHDPHTGAPVMARGIVGSRGDRPTIASPLHKQVYDLGTGAYTVFSPFGRWSPFYGTGFARSLTVTRPYESAVSDVTTNEFVSLAAE